MQLHFKYTAKLVYIREELIADRTKPMSEQTSQTVRTDDEEMSFSSGIAAFEAKHFSRAIQLLSPFAEGGDAHAQHMLAIMHQNGLGVVPSDELGLKWMMKSAKQGYAIAEHGIGFMYLEGECVEKNGAKAVEWFTKAANQGLQGSMTTLAMMYEQGTGVEQDSAKAKELYKAAGFDDLA